MSEPGHRLLPNVLPVNYDVEIDCSPRRATFKGRVTMTLAVVEPTALIELSARDLKLKQPVVRRGKTRIAARLELHPERQSVILRLAHSVPRGRLTLALAFAGRLNAGMHGLYLAKDGSDLAIVSQCEAADARAIFPCFDEPAFKATLKWTVRTDPGLTVVTNGVPGKVVKSGGRAVHHFKPTRVIPTYLAALTVGRYEATVARRVGRIPSRIVAVPGKASQTAFAQEVTARALPWYAAYFKHPYNYQKLDQVAVPGFDAGAMENVGAIFYRQSLLLMQPGAVSWQAQKRIAEVIAHELAHMWFGNLVTMTWWDDLWLNEAFASFMAYKAIDAWKPEWRIWDDFLEASQGALAADALQNTHPIYSAVDSPAEATELFDVITYEKGCAVLRMAERYLGEDTFKAGMRRYVARHKNRNAAGPDLWQALAAEAAEPIADLMDGWIREPGFPLVIVSHSRRGDSDLLHLSQRRFFANRQEMLNDHEQSWSIPIVVRFGDANGVQSQRCLMREREQTVTLETDTPIHWCYPNADAAGFYRLHFDEECLHALLDQGLGQLTAAERMGLIEDQWALVRNGLSDCERFMDVVIAFKHERDHVVTRALASRLASLDDHLVTDEDRPLLRALTRSLFDPHFAELGWEPLPDEPAAQAVRRGILLQALGRVGRDRSVLDEAKRRQTLEAKRPTSAEPNLAGAVVQLAAISGGVKLLEAYLATWRERRQARLSPELQSRYIGALAWFEDPAAVRRILRLCLDGTLPQDQLRLVLAPMLGSRHAGRPTWAFLKRSWKAIAPRVGAMGMARLVEATGSLPTELYADVERFFAKNPVEEAQRALKKALEAMALRRDLVARESPRLGDWLRRNVQA
jgi:puromycin-sensitive aminopeptidase